MLSAGAVALLQNRDSPKLIVAPEAGTTPCPLRVRFAAGELSSEDANKAASVNDRAGGVGQVFNVGRSECVGQKRRSTRSRASSRTHCLQVDGMAGVRYGLEWRSPHRGEGFAMAAPTAPREGCRSSYVTITRLVLGVPASPVVALMLTKRNET